MACCRPASIRRTSAPGRAARVGLPVAAALALAACGFDMPKPRPNPTPSAVYEITFTVRDAPGPVEFENARAYYEVTNRDCVPPQNWFTGAKEIPDAVVPLRLERVSAKVVRARFIARPFRDENYFWMGTCRWGLVSVGIEAKAGNGSITFGTVAPLVYSGPDTIYYPTRVFNDPRGIRHPGFARPGGVLALGGPLFTVTATTRKLTDGHANR